jgi:hypothetical protein
MRWLIFILAFALFFGSQLSFPSARAVDSLPDCIHVRKEARFVVTGYDHLVHVKNECTKAATCQVSTDVTPERHEIRVAVDEEKTVLTRRGSPAREFTAQVSCELDTSR